MRAHREAQARKYSRRGGRFCVSPVGQKVREAHDGDVRLEGADKQGEWRTAREDRSRAPRYWKLCTIRFPCPESDIVGHI
jgi:hypothetical protein